MWRALVFLGLLCLAAYGAVWLANHPETIAVTWAGREYATSLSVGIVVLIGAAILVALLLGAIRFVVTLPAAMGRGSRRRKLARGHSAVSRGIVAIGAGDIAAARRHAGEAERLLGHQPLTLLLKAQAAQASGDRKGAEAAFEQMTAVEETRVLGLRGLYLEARRREDPGAARQYAEEANRLAPAIHWASDAVIEGYSQDGDWRGAIRLVERRTSLGLVDRTTSRRQRAVLMTADAGAREASDPEGALTAAQEAVKLAPDLVPAAAIAARLLSRRGDTKRAARIVETAWTALPHPELAAAYLNLRPGDSAIDRLRRAETLARLSAWSFESRLAIARAAIEARELDRARETLRPLLDEGRPTVRVCMAMAELEGRGGNAGGAREWLARATRAPRDKAWIADGFVAETWAPVSPVTGRLDAFAWETPPELLPGPGGDGTFDTSVFEPIADATTDPEADADHAETAHGAEPAPDRQQAVAEPQPAPSPAPTGMREQRPAEATRMPGRPMRPGGLGETAQPAREDDTRLALPAPQPTSASAAAETAPREPAAPTSRSGEPPSASAAAPGVDRSTGIRPHKLADVAPPPPEPPKAARTHKLAELRNPADPAPARLALPQFDTPPPSAKDVITDASPVLEGHEPEAKAIDAASPVKLSGPEPAEARPHKLAAPEPLPIPMPEPGLPGPSSTTLVRPHKLAALDTQAAPDSAATMSASRAEAESVIFPVAHAPDDPGLDGRIDRRQRFRLRV